MVVHGDVLLLVVIGGYGIPYARGPFVRTRAGHRTAGGSPGWWRFGGRAEREEDVPIADQGGRNCGQVAQKVRIDIGSGRRRRLLIGAIARSVALY